MAGTITKPETRSPRPRVVGGPLATLREEMQELFSRTFGDGEGIFGMERVPSLDVTETDQTIEVKVDLPGYDAKDVDIQLNNNVLTVSGQRKEEKEEKGKTCHRIERRMGSFSRSITLPAAVDEDAVAAECRDGVLAITLPKTEEAKSRKINIKT